MSQFIEYSRADEVSAYQNVRAGELHVADSIQLPNPELSLADNLQLAKANGVKYVFVGVPEDIGPRANCGNGGATNGWRSFQSICLNQQHNECFDWCQVLMLGKVKTDDIQAQSQGLSPEELRPLCAELDQRVEACLAPIFAQGLYVIVIGGGHNNAYPIIKSLNKASDKTVGCVNLDPHADFRAMEGRHSGNPFRYAHHDNALSHYWVMGLHEQKNNRDTIAGLENNGFNYTSYQSLFMRADVSFEQALTSSRNYVADAQLTGVELDVDGIKNAAASAFSVAGFSLEQACRFVYVLGQLDNNRYLHLCESAPVDGSEKEAGQLLTQLAYSYLISRSS